MILIFVPHWKRVLNLTNGGNLGEWDVWVLMEEYIVIITKNYCRFDF